MISYYKNTLLNYFEQLEKIKYSPVESAGIIYNLQNQLIRKTIYIESQIRKEKNLLEKYKIEKSDLPRTRDSKIHSMKLKLQIDRIKKDIEGYNKLLDIFKKIGDGIAFSIFNKWDLKATSFKQNAGFLSGKTGFKLERKIFNYFNRRGLVSVLNDLTTCLKYGDITFKHPATSLPSIIEVKSSNNINERVNRQKQEAENILKYLDTDKTNTLYGKEGNAIRVSAHSAERSFCNIINLMIEESSLNNSSFKKIEMGLYCYVTKHFSPVEFETIQKEINFKAMVFLANDFKYGNSALGYYPLILSIEETGAKYDFITDKLSIFFFLKPEIIEEYFIKRGYSISIKFNNDYFLEINHATKDIHIKTSFHFFNRVFSEFISLKWILKDIEENFNRIETELEIVV